MPALQQEKPLSKLLYTTAGAAEILELSRATVYKEIAAGRLRVVKIGAATRIPADELKRYVESLQE